MRTSLPGAAAAMAEAQRTARSAEQVWLGIFFSNQLIGHDVFLPSAMIQEWLHAYTVYNAMNIKEMDTLFLKKAVLQPPFRVDISS